MLPILTFVSDDILISLFYRKIVIVFPFILWPEEDVQNIYNAKCIR
jgi:hypothetical protein